MKATMTIAADDTDYTARLLNSKRVWVGEMLVPIAPVSSSTIDEDESETDKIARTMTSFDKKDLGPDGDFEDERNGFNMDDVVFAGESFEILLEYPLERPAHLQVEDIPGGKITPRLVLDLIKDAYLEIYRLEEGGDSVPSRVRTRSGAIVLNRPVSKGMFGIWGHGIHNLSVERVEIGDAGDGHALLRVSIGS